MTILEVTLAAVILMGSASASAQIWASSMVGMNRAQQRQLALNRIDGELILLQNHWQQVAQFGPLAPSCRVASQQLLDDLQQTPLGSGVDRQLTLLPEEEGVMVSLQDHNESQARRDYLVKPAALHLCEGAG